MLAQLLGLASDPPVKSGCTPAFEEAIREAQRLGCPEAWIEMMLGQRHMYIGSFEDAAVHLQRAAKAMPDSVAPLAMLITSHLYHGRWNLWTGR